MATYLRPPNLKEFLSLYRQTFSNIESVVRARAKGARTTQAEIAEFFGKPIEDLDVLEVGPGQRSSLKYQFGQKNRYIGIDIELPPSGKLLSGFARDMRRRGAPRAFKNGIKQMLGLSKKFDNAMRAEFGAGPMNIELLEMDAANMSFSSASFEVVVSHNVFEHLPDPSAVMCEISRVLRPGGVAHILTHIYTSDTGAHDPRLYTSNRGNFPYWAHLRPETSKLVVPNCYVNKIRLNSYIEEFDKNWQGALHVNLPSSQELQDELDKLRAKGKLLEYSDEELLTNVLLTTWKKPGS